MFPQVRVGPVSLNDGALTQERGSKDGSLVAVNGHGYYQEPTYRGNIFTMVLAATATGNAAGNLVGAAAAAAVQFALFNPPASGKLLVLLRFRLGIISGTPVGGPIFHGYYIGSTSVAGTGTILSNMVGGGAASIAKGFATSAQAGTALTGGPAVQTHMLCNFATTATAQASPYTIATDDLLDGCLIVPQGGGWAPLHAAAGTSVLLGYSITWEEIPA
jgi:hypothetical protein